MSCLNGAEADAAETQVWITFTLECGYLPGDSAAKLEAACDRVLGMLVSLIMKPDPWLLKGQPKGPS